MQLPEEKRLTLKKRQIAVALVLVLAVGSAFSFRQHFSQSGLFPEFSSEFPIQRSMEPFLPFLFPSAKNEQTAPSQSSSSIEVVSPQIGTSTSSSGSIFKVVYNGATHVDWSNEGSITPGESRNSSKLNFKNEGDTPVRLYLSTSDWTFKDKAGKMLSQDYAQYFRLTWDYDNSIIAANEIKPVTLTLFVSPILTQVETFAFNIVVTVSML